MKKLKIKEKKKRTSIYRTEHDRVCAVVKPLLPGIKKLDFNCLWCLSQYVAEYKKVLTENDPDIKPAFKTYTSWIYKAKAKADFGEVSKDGGAGVDGEESDEESEEEEEEEDGDEYECMRVCMCARIRTKKIVVSRICMNDKQLF